MALIRTTAVVGAISGSVGGTNFVLGTHGAYCRNRISIAKGYTPIQLERRRVVVIARDFWRGLSDNKKQSWRSFASLIQFKNRLGVKRNLNGWQLFCKYVFENYPDETDFDIDCDLVGVSEKIDIVSKDICDDADWAWRVRFIENYVAINAKVWASIPFRTTAKGFYDNWTMVKRGTMVNDAGTWEFDWTPTGAFALAKAGDVIGFKMSFRGFLASGSLLYSANSYFSGLVVHCL